MTNPRGIAGNRVVVVVAVVALPILAFTHWWAYRSGYDDQVRIDRRSEAFAELTSAVKLAGQFLTDPETFANGFTEQYVNRLNANIAIVEGVVLPQKRKDGDAEGVQRLESLLNEAHSLAAEMAKKKGSKG